MGKIKTAFLFWLFIVVCFSSATVNAQERWFTCTVGMAGPGEDPQTFFRLSDVSASPAFTDKWFKAPASRAKEMLAVALAAMASEGTVTVLVDLDSDPIPVIAYFYLGQP